MDTAVEGFGDLGVDSRAEADDAPERCLDVAAWASKPVVKVEVAEGGIEVVTPHQANNPPAQPHAFGISGRAVDRLRGFHELVGLALAVFGSVRRGLLGGCVLCPEITALRDSGSDTDEQGQNRSSDPLKHCNSKPGTNPTHEIPN